MRRYKDISFIRSKDTQNPQRNNIPILTNVKYPLIPTSSEDIYVYTTIGDKYDSLALEYYGDHTLWWVISTANFELEQNSLVPPIGTQLRIPAPNRISNILLQFDQLNNI